MRALPVGDPLADDRTLHVGPPEVDAAPDACADDLGSALEKRSKCRVCAGVPAKRELTVSNPIRSVPKKSSNACRIALLTQLCPDG